MASRVLAYALASTLGAAGSVAAEEHVGNAPRHLSADFHLPENSLGLTADEMQTFLESALCWISDNGVPEGQTAERETEEHRFWQSRWGALKPDDWPDGAILQSALDAFNIVIQGSGESAAQAMARFEPECAAIRFAELSRAGSEAIE